MQTGSTKAGLAALSAVMILFLGVSPSWGDIYRYQDENGDWHYTNVKTDAKYDLFLRSYEKKANEYIDKYRSLIEQAAGRFGVEASLIKAVIHAESAFNHLAISHKGARGLMQLMPATADKLRVNDPFDPAENIFGGTRYLKNLLERFGLDTELALAAYNAGPEAVETYGGIPPYKETQTFVRRVIKYYRGYLAGN
ncbi:MAG: lytic transglycosylase domain-containing protein [Desulfobacteraceae bacterium]